ncbi:MAG TPA: hypothetical protein VIM62_00055 [Acidobacteriaceae bacterium]
MAAWLAVIVFVGWLPMLLRTRRIRKLARERGYTFLGTTPRLPCNWSGTIFARREYSVRNLLLMRYEEVEIAQFDLQSGRGKGSTNQTIAAFRRTGPVRGPAVPRDLIGSYEFEAAGDWLIAYSPRYLATASSVDTWSWEAYQLAVSLLEKAEGKGIPAPRFFTGL